MPTGNPTCSVAGPDAARTRQQALAADLPVRLTQAVAGMTAAGIDALVLTPGTSLRYLTGYDAMPSERLTALVLPAVGEPFLLVPELERLGAMSSPAVRDGLELATWSETENAAAVVRARLSGPADGTRTVGIDDTMQARHLLRLGEAMPGVRQVLAGRVLDALRLVKQPAELAELRAAGAAIDRVHARVGRWLRPGRTERQVGADLAAAIAEEHAEVDFVIVGSGPNGASPHHSLSDRVIESGDPVVVDIGGVLASGYRSDCTRTYVVGTPHPEFVALYEVLQAAQAAGVAAVKTGVTAGSVDAITRAPIAAAGYGAAFPHRTGHGIGLDGHEPPWILDDNGTVLAPGMAFSVEPGIYLEGRFGARIEDIVLVTADGVEPVNTGTHDLVRLPA